MDLGLRGKVVLITGGTAGIGKAAALGFAMEGCRVAICARSADRIGEVTDEFRHRGLDVLGDSVDVANSAQVGAFARRVAEEHGRIDVWLNNAGVLRQRLLMEMPESEWDEVMDTNLKAVFLGSQVAASIMRPQGGGVILNAASFAALIPSAGSGAYAASKAAVLSLTRTLAAELAPWNIRVNAYVPGVISSDMTRTVLAEREQKLAGQVALQRVGQPEEMVGGILYLASDQARYVTGSYLEMSGGKFCVQNPELAWQQ